jgi:hypothetical protein
MVIARTAARASTGMLQDKPLKNRAWPAARASTGWKQADMVKNRAQSVPRSRPRLLRAVHELPAFVMQATWTTPAQENAPLAHQANTRSQRDHPHAPAVVQARIQSKKGPRHACLVRQTPTRLLVAQI